MEIDKINNEQLNIKATSYIEDNLIFDTSMNFIYNGINFTKNSFNTSGTFANIHGYDTSNGSSIVLKIPIEDSIDNINSEIKILSLFNSFQTLYFKKNIFVTKLYKVFMNSNIKDKKFIMIQKKYDGDVFHKFYNLNLDYQENYLLYISLIYQIASILIILQDSFKFVHNDLKPNNIFFKIKDNEKDHTHDNVDFILADFGGSYINFNKMESCGSVRGSQCSFNPHKDMFMMLHLLYTFTNYKKRAKKIITDIVGNWNFNTKYAKSENDEWYAYYDETKFSDKFNPKFIYNRILELYPIIKRDNDLVDIYQQIK